MTRQWLEQLVLGLVLICRASDRAVLELLDACLDCHALSLGSVHNLIHQAARRAEALNQAQDLSAIRVGLHDEIYQAHLPVLVGIDAFSTYCYLLAAESTCDATAWGVHLLDLGCQGLMPHWSIADGGPLARAGQAQAWGDQVPCYGDVFHPLRQWGQLNGTLRRRAAAADQQQQHWQQQWQQCWQRSQANSIVQHLQHARRRCQQAQNWAEDVAVLGRWMREDVLGLAGEDLATRVQLYDWIVGELKLRRAACPQQIDPLVSALQRQRQDLLGFVGRLDGKLQQIGQDLGWSAATVRQVVRLQVLDRNALAYWQRRGQLRNQLRGRFYGLERAVQQALASTPRSNAWVENLNSRLRCYLFLRRQVQPGCRWLALLQFFLNHRPYQRSRVAKRVGKSPAELLTGQPHAHWLELLGYRRFRQPAMERRS